MNSADALIVAVALPLLGALLVALAGRWPNLREAITLGSGALLLGVVLFLVGALNNGESPARLLVEIMPGLSLAFRLEPLGALFALVASVLWIATSIYAIGYMRGHHEEQQTRFFAFFAVAISATMGVALAGNMLTLFIFYEMLTLSTYPLVTHHRTPEARRGGRVYMGILLSTSIAFLLLAVLWTWQLTGTLEFTPGGILAGKAEGGTVLILFVLYAFGAGKAALMPLHRWLPAAMVAPTPVSALLHAVAVVKAGVFTIMKVVVYIFGVDFLAASGGNIAVIYIAATTIVVASLIALNKDNLKARLAYSTISQLSYIVLAAALANHWGIIGGGVHIVMHALGKITLFFCAGAIYITLHKTEISDMNGIGRKMPLTMLAFLLASLSLIGLPPFGGAWSKWFLFLGALEAKEYILIVVFVVSTLLNILYLLPIVVNAFFRPLPENETAAWHEAPLACVLPLLLTALACILFFFYPDPLVQLVQRLGSF
ncbi:MAG: monovalent cation/H+ antiporter subunit D family protein [Candidatus Latescibacteria bacterium]|nr:monovalent cation/H+ antiporter subunit D family protein [Candidatus Latescibacterota bacterium]